MINYRNINIEIDPVGGYFVYGDQYEDLGIVFDTRHFTNAMEAMIYIDEVIDRQLLGV